MLSRDVLAVDLDSRHWKNLMRLAPRGGVTIAPTLYVFIEDGRCVKAIHNKRGPVPGVDFDTDRDDVEALREAHDVERVALVPIEAIGEFMHAWQTDFAMDRDWEEQLLGIVSSLLEAAKTRVVWHPMIARWPSLPKIPGRGAIDRIWPDETCVGLFVFEGRVPFTSLILGKSGGKVTLMTTLDAFGLADGPLDWAGQHRMVADLCAKSFSPLHAALWIDRGSWSEMVAGPRPLSYLRLATRRGRALVSPRPKLWKLGLWAARVFRRL
ncbi:MAG: hypothetical protein IT350_16280 [Deltaproteobacteria bacterium]|nr:hypothetical protein [Deltaproteobacteria bacterium]